MLQKLLLGIGAVCFLMGAALLGGFPLCVFCVGCCLIINDICGFMLTKVDDIMIDAVHHLHLHQKEDEYVRADKREAGSV